MEKNKVIELIDKKIKEHQFEINGAQKDLLDERGKLKKSVIEASKMLVLKDKMMFHKSAMLVLEELKQEIGNS